VDVSAGGEDFAKVFVVLSRSSIPLYGLLDKTVRAARVLRAYAMIGERKDQGSSSLFLWVNWKHQIYLVEM